jgi:hypothetical protein
MHSRAVTARHQRRDCRAFELVLASPEGRERLRGHIGDGADQRKPNPEPAELLAAPALRAVEFLGHDVPVLHERPCHLIG